VFRFPRHHVPPAGTVPDRFLAEDEVNDDQKDQIHHATAQCVADGQIGRLREGDAGNASGQFGQRGDRGQQRQPNPATRQAGALGDRVPVMRQLIPGETDQHGAEGEL